MAAMIGLIMVQVLYDDFRSMRDLGARGLDLWMYVLVKMPSLVANVLPVALLISLLFVLGKLHRANEFTALRAAGVGLMRITAPVWIVGVIACGLAWWLNSTVVPWSVETSRGLMENIEFRKQAHTLAADRIGAVDSVGFNNPRAGRLWFFNRYSQVLHRGFGVTVSELDGQRRELTRIVATEAAPNPRGEGWIFKYGRALTFDPASGELTGTEPFTERLVSQYHEDPKLMLLLNKAATDGGRPVDLSFPELREVIDYYEVEKSPKVTPFAVRYFGLIADTLGPLIVIAIAIPFAVTGVRVNPVVGVSKSLGLFIVYYIFTNVASSLATKDIVDPVVAAWLPNLGMIGLAVWLFARLR